MSTETPQSKRFSRREFLKVTVALAGGGAVVSLASACAGQPAATPAATKAAAPAATTAPAQPAPAATQAPAAPRGVKEVKVGQVLPLTGGVAAVGAQMRTGSEIALAEINAEGGIKSLDGAKITMVFADSKGTPDGGSAETERLIVQEKVSLMTGAYQSAVTFPATAVAERYRCPWLVNVAAKDEITIGRGFKYVCRDFKTMTMDVEEILLAVNAFEKALKMAPKTHYILCEGTDWGRSTAAGVKKLFPAAGKGYEIVGEEIYPPGQSDFTAQILKIKAAKPDMLHLAMYTPDHIVFNKQYMEQKLDLPFGMVSYGSGSEDPTTYKALPPESYEYMFVEEDWDPRGRTAPWYPDINEQVKAKLGYDMNSYVACAYGSMYVIKDILERAKYDADLAKYRDNIRDAMYATDITKQNALKRKTKAGVEYQPAFVRGMSRIVFDKEGQNPYAYGTLSQWINNKTTVLYAAWVNPPEGELVGTPKWPVPKWSER